MKIMAIDLGDARTGLAISDKTEFLASPAGVIFERSRDKLLLKICDKASELSAEMIVMGHPLNMDGSRGERAALCAEMAEKIKEQTGLPVVLWDERQTTVEAHGILSVTGCYGKKRKENVDAVAATLILEGYLTYRKNHK